MRHLFLIVSLLAAEAPVHVSVTLTATPATQGALNNPVTLTAAATTALKPLPMRLPESFRYTFTAQPTSPAGATMTIATNVATKSVTWNPPSPGVYTLAVRATYVERASLADLHGAPFGTASLSNYQVFTTGPDLIPYATTSVGECAITPTSPCTNCPYVTIPLYVKNIGNVTDSKQITITVKYLNQVIQTWTTTAPAWGQQVKVGSYTTFPWNCPPITSAGNAPNYSMTVDSGNAVHESNEQNNTKGFYMRFPDKTTFKAAP
jgi:CARDB